MRGGDLLEGIQAFCVVIEMAGLLVTPVNIMQINREGDTNSAASFRQCTVPWLHERAPWSLQYHRPTECMKGMKVMSFHIENEARLLTDVRPPFSNSQEIIRLRVISPPGFNWKRKPITERQLFFNASS